MGIYIETFGKIKIEPAFTLSELSEFNSSIKNKRHNTENDINELKEGYPSLNCPMEISECGKFLLCNSEKYQNNEKWIKFILNKYKNHIFNGVIDATFEGGEESVKWEVKNNKFKELFYTKSEKQNLFIIAKDKFKELINKFITKNTKKIVSQFNNENLDFYIKQFLNKLIETDSKKDFESIIKNIGVENINIKKTFYGKVGKYSDGEDVFVHVENGTLLMAAAKCGNTMACVQLIEFGADKEIKDDNGYTAFDHLNFKKNQSYDERIFLERMLKTEQKKSFKIN